MAGAMTTRHTRTAAQALRLRPARKADASALAVLVDVAAHGLALHIWSTLKQPWQSALEIGRARAARETGDFSYRNALIAEIDGEIAAALVDYRIADPYLVDPAEVPEVVRALVKLESMVPGSWYVNVVATFAEFRGMGIGGRLLAAAEERARAAGVDRLSIIVADENEGARRLYERTGYRAIAREPVVPFPGCPHGGDWVLMVKAA